MAASVCAILDDQGRQIAEVDIHGVEDAWYYGRIVSEAFPEGLRRDLEWYDEVVSNQMLSYLDDAVHAVERHGLSVRFPDGACHRVYSLHIERSRETTFRTTPVPPPSSSRFDSSTVLG